MMTAQVQSFQEAGVKSGLTSRFDIRSYTMIIALVGLWILFSILTKGLFIVPRNLSNLFEQSAETAILAVGMTLVIVSAQIDLSVGSLSGLSGGVAAICQVWLHWNSLFSIFAGLLVGLVFGLFQGWWVAFQRVPSFIVTLGGMMIFRGILIGLTNGTSVAPLTPNFLIIGQGYLNNSTSIVLGVLAILAYLFFVIRGQMSRRKLGFPVRTMISQTAVSALIVALVVVFLYVMNVYAGVPIPVFILLVLAFVFTFLATRTRFGRHVYALGGNLEAARMSGIAVRKRVLTVFALNGLLAGVTGVVLISRLGAGTADAGTNFELNAIAACVIGGSSLMGGIGTVAGSVIGALVMGSIDNGMSLLNAAPFWQYVVPGVILILAVWLDMTSKSRNAS